MVLNRSFRWTSWICPRIRAWLALPTWCPLLPARARNARRRWSAGCLDLTPAVGKSPEALEVGGPKPGRERINGNFRILKWRYDSTLERGPYLVGIFHLHRPWIGLIYGGYLQFRFLKWPLKQLGINLSRNHQEPPTQGSPNTRLPVKNGIELACWVMELLVSNRLPSSSYRAFSLRGRLNCDHWR